MSTTATEAPASTPAPARSHPDKSFRPLFVVGCPRSGTTWVQLLLSQHPTVATAPETQIFAYYLDHFQRQWRHEHEGPGRTHQGNAGLSRLLSEDEFEELCRTSAALVLDKIAARRPGAAVVVEKSPRHALHAQFIRRLFPGSRFLHVVRDPRDTVASLLAAGRSWGGGWAPRNAIEAARLWNEHVRAARRVAQPESGYHEVRFEDLVVSPVARLREILDWLELDADGDFCESAVAACELSKLRNDADGKKMPLPSEKSPREFFRKGTPGGWQEDLSRIDARIVERLCGDLMDELGYAPAVNPARRRPLRIPVHDALLRLREAVDWQLARLTNHI